MVLGQSTVLPSSCCCLVYSLMYYTKEKIIYLSGMLRGRLFAFIYICKWCTYVMVTHGYVCLRSFMHVMCKWSVKMVCKWCHFLYKKWCHFQPPVYIREELVKCYMWWGYGFKFQTSSTSLFSHFLWAPNSWSKLSIFFIG